MLDYVLPVVQNKASGKNETWIPQVPPGIAGLLRVACGAPLEPHNPAGPAQYVIADFGRLRPTYSVRANRMFSNMFEGFAS